MERYLRVLIQTMRDSGEINKAQAVIRIRDWFHLKGTLAEFMPFFRECWGE
jgi:hypothetical protein